jgi:hypothetical protein
MESGRDDRADPRGGNPLKEFPATHDFRRNFFKNVFFFHRDLLLDGLSARRLLPLYLCAELVPDGMLNGALAKGLRALCHTPAFRDYGVAKGDRFRHASLQAQNGI